MKKLLKIIFLMSFIIPIIVHSSQYDVSIQNFEEDKVLFAKNNSDIMSKPVNNSETTYVKNAIYLTSGESISYSACAIDALILYNITTGEYITVNDSEYCVSQSGYYIIYGMEGDKIQNISDSISIDQTTGYILQ